MVFGIGEISDCKFSTELRMVFCFQNCSGHTVRKKLPYAACIFLTSFFTAIYIVFILVLQTIYVINKKILQFLGLKSAVHNQERL